MAPTSPSAASVAGAALLLGGLAVWALASELPDFWDPCMSWGIGGNGTMTTAPRDECPSLSGTSETRSGAAARLALVDGTAIVASVLAVVAAWHRNARLALAAGLLMAGETVLLFFGLSIAFLLALASAALFLTAAVRWRKPAATVSDGL